MFKILSKEIGEYKKDTIMTPLFMVGEVAMECLIPAVMAILIDHMYTESVTMVIRYGAILITLALVSLYCGASSARAGARAGAGFAKNLRKDLFYHVQEFSFKDIDDFSSSSLVTRLTSDVSSVQNAFQMIIRMAVRAPLMLIFSIVMALRINARMALIFFAIVPFLAIGLLAIFRTAHPIFRRI
ncbi:MAG: ABC transporter ATP-binding protein, partial [Erysipelotrichaceae bacterium]|nr:ABC transporter ATP-binding protein [Erysipelotrichaceae bacterium]